MQPRQVGRQPGPQPPRTCTISGAACATTPGGNGVAFAASIAVAATLTAPITASVANFILLLPQKPIANLRDAVTRACAAAVLTVLYDRVGAFPTMSRPGIERLLRVDLSRPIVGARTAGIGAKQSSPLSFSNG
jgi:hypothetical protein